MADREPTFAEDPSALQPALRDAARAVLELLRDPTGAGAVALSRLPVSAAAALVLAAEGFRWSAPEGTDPAKWAGAWLLTLEMNEAAGGDG